jgi:hypothetical protein
MPRNLGGGATVGRYQPRRGGPVRPHGGGAQFGGPGGGGATGHGGTAGVTGQNIFQPVVDAAHNVAARFNTEAALNAVNVADTAGDAMAELGRAFSVVGKRAADDIAWTPGSAEFFSTLGDHLTRLGQQTAEQGAQVRRLEDEKVRRAEEKDPRERAWDIAANE